MDHERLTVASNVDDELRNLITVTPSPEFEARVRARVADLESSRRAPGVWWVASAVATAAVAIAVVMLTRGGSKDEHLAATSFAPPVAAFRPSWSSTVVRSTTETVSVTPTTTKAPEVVVQRGQAAALLQFAALTAAGRVVDDPPQMISEFEPADGVLPPLTIAPVTIDPLALLAPPGDPK